MDSERWEPEQPSNKSDLGVSVSEIVESMGGHEPLTVQGLGEFRIFNSNIKM